MTDLLVDGRIVAAYDWCAPRAGVVRRPAVHPLHTWRGHRLTGAYPDDHPWHYGLGLALPDVDGVNLWGGPSYRPGVGYRDGPLGSVRESAPPGREDDGLRHELVWCDPEDRPMLRETRVLRTGGGADCWWLDWHSTLIVAGDRPVRFDSPGSLGRAGAGYGGFFWRLPTWSATVLTADGTGEQEINGVRADWLAITAEPDDGTGWTAVLTARDPRTAADPWFVRAGEYLGVGSALAWDRPVSLAPGRVLPITLRVRLVDRQHAVPDKEGRCTECASCCG